MLSCGIGKLVGGAGVSHFCAHVTRSGRYHLEGFSYPTTETMKLEASLLLQTASACLFLFLLGSVAGAPACQAAEICEALRSLNRSRLGWGLDFVLQARSRSNSATLLMPLC